MIPADADRDKMTELALADETIQSRLDGAEPKKVIAVPGRLVNIVV